MDEGELSTQKGTIFQVIFSGKSFCSFCKLNCIHKNFTHEIVESLGPTSSVSLDSAKISPAKVFLPNPRKLYPMKITYYTYLLNSGIRVK